MQSIRMPVSFIALVMLMGTAARSEVVVNFSSDRRARIRFEKEPVEYLPSTKAFKVNSPYQIKNMLGHRFKIEMDINNIVEEIYGLLLVYQETDFTRISNIELKISQEIVTKVKNGEISIITIRDPSSNEAVILKTYFGNRQIESREDKKGTDSKGFIYAFFGLLLAGFLIITLVDQL